MAGLSVDDKGWTTHMEGHMHPEPTRATVLLDGDRRVTIRPVDPGDGAALMDFYARLSRESRRQRFFHLHQVTFDDCHKMAAIEDDGGAALVAVTDDGTVVADARCAREGRSVADLGIIVSDDYQGFGLGKIMLDGLMAAAATAGITTIAAQVGGYNVPMRRLLSEHHFVIVDRDGSSMVEAVCRTDGSVPDWGADTNRRPRILIEDRGGWFGSLPERYLRDAGFAVAVCPGSPADGSCDLLASGTCRLAEGADAIICSASDEESREVLAAHEAAPDSTPLFVPVGPDERPSMYRAVAIKRSGTPDELLDILRATVCIRRASPT
jgi:RimJ/RimL family protein N-acetyltransferase